MKALLIFLVLLTTTESVWARRAPVRLMPGSVQTNEDQQVAVLERHSASAPTATAQYREKTPYDRPASQLGIELGMIGRKQATNGDILGMQALIGARAFLRFPVYGAFTLKPSFGYFYKKESIGAVSVTQNHLEGGLGVLFTAMQDENVKWHLGVSNRVTRATSTSTVYSNSTSSPADLFFRSGPTTGILVRLGGQIYLVADFEVTWSFESPTRSYTGLTSGLAFEL